MPRRRESGRDLASVRKGAKEHGTKGREDARFVAPYFDTWAAVSRKHKIGMEFFPRMMQIPMKSASALSRVEAPHVAFCSSSVARPHSTSADRMARRGSVAAAARVLERLIAHPFPSISRAAPPVVDGKWPCARGDRGLARRVPSPARRRSGSLATTSFRSAEQAEDGAEARGFDATSIDGPVGEFERRVRAGDLVDGDARQAVALRQLQALRDRLVASHLANASSPLPAQGVYLHGGVGRGKTMLMDAFHATLPLGLASLARAASISTSSWPRCIAGSTPLEA